MQKPRNYIAVEGPIGVGKTTLAKRLATSLDCGLLLERPEDNPFLTRFYSDPARHALSAQLCFLFQRVEQLRSLSQPQLFAPIGVSDFLLEKDALFAQVALAADEYQLYRQVYDHLTREPPAAPPDLVIYLQAPTEVLQKRIAKRAIGYEQQISAGYLDKLNRAYSEFFHYYDAAPLVIINAADADFANRDADYQQLWDYLLDIDSGRHYFNPRSLG